MPIDFDGDDEILEKSRSRMSDPLADHKKKARQRLLGAVFFSFFVFVLCLVLLRDEPRSFVDKVIVEDLFEARSLQKEKKDDKVFGEKLNLSIRDRRIIELSNSMVWMVRVGVFTDKKNAQILKDRLTSEGKLVLIVPKKIGILFIYYVKVGPLNQESAEKFRRQALSRGLDADIDRL